jgi:hypothetical protein
LKIYLWKHESFLKLEAIDCRWAGSWGIKADFIAKTMCSLIYINLEDLQVCFSKPVDFQYPVNHNILQVDGCEENSAV